MTILLSEEAANRLNAEASRRGIRAEQLVEQLIDAAIPVNGAAQPNQSSIDILAAWEAETATDDPAELERRQSEFEEFKKELNRTRIMTDGPDARVPFP